jgi:predicted MPP superfamily phosphohydrolase
VDWLRRIGIGVLVVILLLLAWGGLIEPRLILDVEEESAAIANLPPEWEGAEIAVIADIQAGMWGANTAMVRRIIQRLIDRRPAAVLIAGDFVYKADPDPEPEIHSAVELVRPLSEAGIPTLAVLGNHDYSLNYRDDPKSERLAHLLRSALEAAGVRVLHNAAVPLPPAGAGINQLYVVGIGSDWANEDAPRAALRGVPAHAPRVVFMHNPGSFTGIPPGAAPLAIAAHTHGGQLRVPLLPRWSWMELVADEDLHVDGWIHESYGAPGNRLYVNRGIGFSTVPIRINAPPEITLFTLQQSRR